MVATTTPPPPSSTTPTLPQAEKIECRIGDRIYDITKFLRVHPGGRVISYYANEDATEAFNAFHFRSARARKMLEALPSRAALSGTELMGNDCERTSKLLTSFRILHADLKREGWFEPSLPHVCYRIVELVGMFALSFFLLHIGSWWSVVLSIIIGGLAGGRAGWLQHEGGHASLTGDIGIDKWLQKISIAFGLITYNWKWNHMHNKHHATPQRENYDLDVDTLPFVAFYKEALDRGRRASITPTWWIRWQHYTFIPLTTIINVVFWHLYLHPKEYLFRPGKRDFYTLGFVVLRYVIHFTSCPSDWSIMMRLSTFWLTMFISGMYLFGNFSLNHTHLPVTEPSDHKNWIEYGIDYTINVDSSPLCNWWMGYLNCQVEHHLFPQMPQYKQPQITQRVAQWCKMNNLKYQSIPYWTAVKATINNLKNVAHYAVEKERAALKEKNI